MLVPVLEDNAWVVQSTTKSKIPKDLQGRYTSKGRAAQAIEVRAQGVQNNVKGKNAKK